MAATAATSRSPTQPGSSSTLPAAATNRAQQSAQKASAARVAPAPPRIIAAAMAVRQDPCRYLFKTENPSRQVALMCTACWHRVSAVKAETAETARLSPAPVAAAVSAAMPARFPSLSQAIPVLRQAALFPQPSRCTPSAAAAERGAIFRVFSAVRAATAAMAAMPETSPFRLAVRRSQRQQTMPSVSSRSRSQEVAEPAGSMPQPWLDWAAMAPVEAQPVP